LTTNEDFAVSDVANLPEVKRLQAVFQERQKQAIADRDASKLDNLKHELNLMIGMVERLHDDIANLENAKDSLLATGDVTGSKCRDLIVGIAGEIALREYELRSIERLNRVTLPDQPESDVMFPMRSKTLNE
jgi:hypothetical protein